MFLEYHERPDCPKMRQRMTEREYLGLEERAETRHEFVDGTMIAMAGETGEHEDIAFNIVTALRPTAQAKSCRLRGPNVKMRVSGQRYRYPDVYIVCGPRGNDPRLEENPCLILEVISPSTADVDRGAKLEEYTNIASLQRYLIVEQTKKHVVVYRRTNEGWLYESVHDGTLEVPCLETVLTFEQIYAGLEFNEPDETSVSPLE